MTATVALLKMTSPNYIVDHHNLTNFCIKRHYIKFYWLCFRINRVLAFLKLVAFRLKELWERQKLCEIIIFTGRNLLLDLCVKCSCFWTGDAIWGIIITNINMKNFKTFISLLFECLVEDCLLLQKHYLLHYLLFAPTILSIVTQLKSSNEP